MLFSAKTEYACVAMLELALRHADPQPVRLKTIHDTHGIPDRFLVQILLQLKGAGLIHSTRGASGGYRLARPPAEITLAHIIGVIEDLDGAERSRSRSHPTDPVLATAPVQTVRAVWRDIGAAQQRVLEETTLAELVRRSQEDLVLSYQI